MSRLPRTSLPRILDRGWLVGSILQGLILTSATACTCDPFSSTPEPAQSATAAAAPVPEGSARACPEYAGGIQLGEVAYDSITEASGLVASRHFDDVLWTHNDSGDVPRFFAMSPSGKHLGVYRLAGADARDWEDMALGPAPSADRDFLYLGDIGDNNSEREHIVVYRVVEPQLAADPNQPQQLDDVETFRLVYPDGPHDSETLLVDPRRGDLLLVTREHEGPTGVYAAPTALQQDRDNHLELRLELSFGTPPLTGSHLVTGGDVSPEGDLVLIKTYTSAFVWTRREEQSLIEALSETPCAVPLAVEPQGEAVAFRADGRGYFTVSERVHQPVYFFEQLLEP